jgi:hypothetical protein
MFKCTPTVFVLVYMPSCVHRIERSFQALAFAVALDSEQQWPRATG